MSVAAAGYMCLSVACSTLQINDTLASGRLVSFVLSLAGSPPSLSDDLADNGTAEEAIYLRGSVPLSQPAENRER